MALDRRSFVATSAAAMVSAACSRRANTPVKPPNILMVLPDQLRVRDLGFNGGVNVPTPNIDRLASQGTVFTNALSSCPLCTPYRSMLLSGRYPTHTGMVINWLESNPRDPSIAAILADAGYDTGYIGKWHLNAGKMKRDGLTMTPAIRRLEEIGDYSQRPRVEQEYVREHPEPEFVPPGPQRRGFRYWAAYNFHTEYKPAYYYRDTAERLTMPGFETDAEIDMAIDFMKQRRDQPFFLTVAPHPPHQPWVKDHLPDGYLDRVRPELVRDANVPQNGPAGRGDLRIYYAMVANFDDGLGRLMAAVEQMGLAANTIVMLSSDHGEMMGSHGKWEKMSPYEEAVNVPLIVRWPGKVPVRKVDALFTPVDHLATLSTLCGVTVEKSIHDGVDLSGSVSGGTETGRDAVLMANYSSHWDYFHTSWPWPEWRAVRTRQHSYVKWLSGEEMLFDNQTDPFQMRNLAGSDTATLARMRARLADLLHEQRDEFLPGPAYAAWFDQERNLVRTAFGSANS